METKQPPATIDSVRQALKNREFASLKRVDNDRLLEVAYELDDAELIKQLGQLDRFEQIGAAVDLVVCLKQEHCNTARGLADILETIRGKHVNTLLETIGKQVHYPNMTADYRALLSALDDLSIAYTDASRFKELNDTYASLFEHPILTNWAKYLVRDGPTSDAAKKAVTINAAQNQHSGIVRDYIEQNDPGPNQLRSLAREAAQSASLDCLHAAVEAGVNPNDLVDRMLQASDWPRHAVLTVVAYTDAEPSEIGETLYTRADLLDRLRFIQKQLGVDPSYASTLVTKVQDGDLLLSREELAYWLEHEVDDETASALRV